MKLILQYNDGTAPVTYLDWQGIVPPPLPGDEIWKSGKLHRVTSRRYRLAHDHFCQSGKMVASTYATELVLNLTVVTPKEATRDQDTTALLLAHPWLPALGSEVFIGQTHRSKGKPVLCLVVEHGRSLIARYGSCRVPDDDKLGKPCFWTMADDIKMGPYFEDEEASGKLIPPGGWQRVDPNNTKKK